MGRKPRRRGMLDGSRLAAVASPVRIELIGALQPPGPASIRELAARMERPADGLYHHVRLLQKAGVVRVESERKVGRRMEAVYALTAERFVGKADPTSPEIQEATIRTAQAVLRLAGREFVRAIRAKERECRGNAPRMLASRQKAWLTEEGLVELHRYMRKIERLLRDENQNRQGQLFVLTSILVPLIPRRRI